MKNAISYGALGAIFALTAPLLFAGELDIKPPTDVPREWRKLADEYKVKLDDVLESCEYPDPLERIAGVLVLRRRWREPSVIDGEVAAKAKLGSRCGDLALTVRLHDAARYQCVGAGIDRLSEHIVQLAHLVAAEPDANAIFAFHPKTRSAEMDG